MSSHNDSFAASGSSPTVDFLYENHGSIFLLRPLTPSAASWFTYSRCALAPPRFRECQIDKFTARRRITVAQLFHVNALFAQSFAQSHPNMPKHAKEGQLGHSKEIGQRRTNALQNLHSWVRIPPAPPSFFVFLW